MPTFAPRAAARYLCEECVHEKNATQSPPTSYSEENHYHLSKLSQPSSFETDTYFCGDAQKLFSHKIILFIMHVDPNIGHKIAAISCANAQEKVEHAGTPSVHPAAVVLGNVSSQPQTRLCGCCGSDGACLLCQQRLELRIQKQAVMKQVKKEVTNAMLEHLNALGRRGLFCLFILVFIRCMAHYHTPFMMHLRVLSQRTMPTGDAFY